MTHALARNLVLASAFVLLGALAFFGSWSFGFVNYDDPTVVVANELIEGPGDGHAAAIFSAPHDHAYLPLYYASFWIDHALGGKSPRVYHLINLLIHGGNALLLAALIRRLPLGEPRRRFVAAGLGAAVFLVHPVVVESVVWVSGRKDLVSGFLLLLALTLFLDGVTRARPWRSRFLAPLLYLAALFAKASVLPGFLIAFLLARLSTPAERKGTRALVLETLPLALVALLALVVHLAVAAAEGTTGGHEGAFLPRAVGMAGALGRYLVNALAPVRLALVYDLPLDGSFGAWQLLGLLALFLGLLALFTWRRSAGPRRAALLWFLVALLPFNNLLPRFAGVMADRYLYLPIMGLALLVASLVARARRPRAGLVLVLLLIAGFGTLSFFRTRVWSDSRRLWESARAAAPAAALPLLQLGQIQEEEALGADPARAQVLLDDAARLFAEAEDKAADRRQRAQALLKLASLETRRGRFQLALEAYERLDPLIPEQPSARDRDELDHAAVTRATALAGLGRLDEAKALLATIDGESSAWKEARHNEAVVILLEADRILREATFDVDRKRGVELYQEGLGIYASLARRFPDFRRARVDQASALIGARWIKDYEIEVTKAVNALVADFPDDAQAWYHHARVYGELALAGNQEAALQALNDLKVSVRLDPHREEPYLLLVRLLRALGSNKEAKLVLDKGLASLPDSSRLKLALAETYVSFGYHHRNTGALDLALEAAGRAIDVLPDSPTAWQLLGEVDQAQAEAARDPNEQAEAWGRAEKAYRHLLELDPGNAVARRGIALFHRVRGYAYLRTVLPDDIPETMRREQRAEIRRQAMEEFRSAVASAPGLEDLEAIRAQLEGYAAEFRDQADQLIESGRAAEAWLPARSALHFAPDDPENLALAARTKAAMALTDDAIAYYEQALEQDPRHLRSLFDCGRLLFERNRPAPARALMRRFLEAAPDDDEGALGALRRAAREVIAVVDRDLGPESDR
ncbi:MAG: tetratricopeptide repeat protein [Planctomycetes bacterium]|nr:tetratricopeptide repeat protein [Planctomycetota bacterium]